jgi:protein involved in polysaccharide export with SLBB domain
MARTFLRLALVAALAAPAGCTAVSNPIADGIPVRLVPHDLLAVPKVGSEPVPLCALGQPEPDVYRLGAGDVLGVFIDGFLGEHALPLPVNVAPPLQIPEQNRLAPSAGYPVTVQEDGTVVLPGVPPVSVRGRTVAGARDAIRSTYLDRKLIRSNNDRLLVTLLYPRHVEVLVFRQEAQAFVVTADGSQPAAKRNTGRTVELPAHQNDVLHALVRTGGLPESDAYNAVIIYRNGCADPHVRQEVLRHLEAGRPGVPPGCGGALLRIPLRVLCGEPLPFGPSDVILRQGDIVFLEARDEQVYYTAGLLPPGKHVLPRDQDLDVLEAVAETHGSLYNGAFGGSNLSGNLISPGLGNPSPSLLVVLRRCPGRGQVPIVVDLREALRHEQERLLIRPGDVLILQEKPAEGLLRYASQTFFNFDLFWIPFRTSNAAGVVDVAAPDRLPQRVGSINVPTPNIGP